MATGSNDIEANMDEENKSDDEAEERLNILKLEKMKAKTSFTKTRRQLLGLLDEFDLPSRQDIMEACEKLEAVHERAFSVMVELLKEYSRQGDRKNRNKTTQEIEQLHQEFTEAQNRALEYLDNRKDDRSSVSTESPKPIRFTGTGKPSRVVRQEFQTSHPLWQIDDGLPQWQYSWQKISEDHPEHLGSKPKDAYEFDDGKKTANPTEVNQVWRTSGKSNVRGASCEPPYEPVGAEVNQTWRTSEKSNVRGVSWGPPYESVGAERVVKSSGFGERRRPESVEVKHDEDKRRFSQSRWFPDSEPVAIGQDLWKQLRRVTIPVFSGDKRTYENWKAAFMACIDKSPATPEFKLLQLRQYLSGEALKAIETLGHSASAYQAAKERLERKYGGKRRQIAIYMEDVDNFRPIRPGNHKDIENFADLLDIVVVNLKDAGRLEELGDGSLYIKLQKKITESMLAQYHRWLFENGKLESVETLRKWVMQEAEFRTVAHETVRGFSNQENDVGNRKGKPLKIRSYFTTGENNQNAENRRSGYSINDIFGRRTCKICGSQHGVWKCESFRKMDVSKRWEMAKQQKLCYRCLGDNHHGVTCPRSRICGIKGCGDTHNRLLHQDRNEPDQNCIDQKLATTQQNARPAGVDKTQQRVPEAIKEPSEVKSGRNEFVSSGTEEEQPKKVKSTFVSEVSESAKFVTPRTVPVILKNGNRKIKVNALLDDASTQTYINADIAAQLGLQGKLQQVTVNVLNGQIKTFDTMPVEFELESLNGLVDMKMSAFTAARVTGNMNVVEWSDLARKWEHLRGIEFWRVGPRPIVDILIGLDHVDLHYSYRDIRGNPGEPIARLTPLGWTCISGSNGKTLQTNFGRMYLTHGQSTTDEIAPILQKFWELESSGISVDRAVMTLADQSALEKVRSSLRFQNHRYQVGIPWKKEPPDLPNNHEMAVKRLVSTEKHLLRKPDVAEAYSKSISQYMEKGYIRKVSPDEKQPSRKWFLPHFAIVKPQKATTKVRIVFDGSAKCDGVSLNDAIHQGPKLQRELFDVLLRFRRSPVAIACDISEMYLRIEIAPEDRPFHRFLWRDLNQCKEPEEYEFSRVVFGINSSPFQAQFVTQTHAQKHQEDLPMASETALNSTYMDDSLDSVEDDKDGILLYQQLTKLWRMADMYAHKWLLNSSAVLAKIPVEERASEINLANGHLPSVKTLGLLWLANEDVFSFRSNVHEESTQLTKRAFLKRIALLFDPLGFLTPFSIRGKILMQEMWTSGVNWDEKLDEALEGKAYKWLEELPNLPSVTVPRCLKLSEEKVVSSALHVFVDASPVAYGATAYARYIYQSGSISRRIIAAKARVAPLKVVSLPRLEMMGAIVGLRLAGSISNVLEFLIKQATFWSDSMDVLWWIRRPSRQFKPFIANRVGEIHSVTNPDQWRFVPGKDNVGDMVTRGMSLMELAENKLWWTGPEFLGEEESKWPKIQIEKNLSEDMEVRKASRSKYSLYTSASSGGKKLSTEDMKSSQEDRSWRLDPSRFSDWVKLKRIYAWVCRFLYHCRLSSMERSTGELTVEELEDAETQIIKYAQMESFPDEYGALADKKSKLMSLNPKIDDDGVLRCDGRLKYAENLPYDVRFPVILARKSWVTKLIVKYHHEQDNHVSGTNQTLASLSTRYWIVSGREEIREWENQCAECKRRKAKPTTQMMAPLPKIRFRMTLRAFSQAAVDFGGPFLTVQGRGKQRHKRYLCLFTCLASRAVHLEIAFGLDTNSFLNAFYRMVNRRGLPQEMLSDNGGNFVGADKELRSLVKALDKDKIQKSTAHQGIKWKFNPPLSPHFGGVYEVMIKAAKKAIYGILGNADVSNEELMTAFTGAEALINSRPLTYQSTNPADDVPLTPNHFLIGQVGGNFAAQIVDKTDYNPRKRWRRVQELVRHFWSRWLREWVPGLNARKKWFHPQRDFQVDDIVLIISPDTPRGNWPLGRIIEVFPGKDGHVRVASVQVGKNVIKRPIVKLCPLEVSKTN